MFKKMKEFLFGKPAPKESEVFGAVEKRLPDFPVHQDWREKKPTFKAKKKPVAKKSETTKAKAPAKKVAAKKPVKKAARAK